MSYDSCQECGAHPCRCDQEAEGYECDKCGHVPTYRELQTGSCSQCVADRMAERKRRPAMTEPMRGEPQAYVFYRGQGLVGVLTWGNVRRQPTSAAIERLKAHYGADRVEMSPCWDIADSWAAIEDWLDN